MKTSDWERGFLAGYSVVFPRLVEALEKLAKLESEVKGLKATIQIHDMEKTHEAICKVEKVIADTRKQHREGF